MPRRIAVRRILGGVLALALTGVAVIAWVEAQRVKRQLNDAEAERVQYTVDLSRAGVTELPLIHTLDLSHGRTVALHTEGSMDDLTTVLADLQGRVELFDSSGVVLQTVELFDPHQYYLPLPDRDVGLAYFFAIPRGSYTLRITIDEPVKALAGVSQSVYARYEFCGLEYMAVTMLQLTGWIAVAPALLIGGLTLLGVRRHGWRVKGVGTEREQA